MQGRHDPALHERVLDALASAVVVRDLDGAVVYANLAARARRDLDDDVVTNPLLAGDGSVVGSVEIATGEHVRAAHMAAVSTVGELAVTATSLRELYDGAVAAAVDALHADIGVLLLAGRNADAGLLLEAGIGVPPERIGTYRASAAAGSLAGHVLGHDDVTVVGPVTPAGAFPPPPLLAEAGAVSGTTALVRVDGRPAGVLGIATRTSRLFDAGDLAVTRTIANIVAHAIERDRAQQQLSRLAITDGLTGLANGVLFRDRLRHALTQRPQRAVGVAIAGIDGFRDVNDGLGRESGDQLLVTVAERLAAATRPGDTLARGDGDQFGALFVDVGGIDEAVALARRLADTVAAEPIVLDGRELHVSLGVGVVVADEPDVAPDALVRDAELALRRARSGGRSRVEVVDEQARTSVLDRLHLTSDLVDAMAAGDLVVHYQPEVALADGDGDGGTEIWAEALVRWQHRERGLLPPAAFVALAERTGLVVRLGEIVLEQAVAQLATWTAMGPGAAPTSVSVNISPRQLVEGDLIGLTADLLDRFGVAPASLWFELTENAVVREPERALAALHELRGLGVGVALDDFGTGYASLTYARWLPVDALKIDRSFISGMGTNLRDDGIVQATIHLAHSLGILTIAEGVETAEQLDALRALGCDYAQGYLLACPGEPSEVEAFTRAYVAGRSRSPSSPGPGASRTLDRSPSSPEPGASRTLDRSPSSPEPGASRTLDRSP